MDADVIVVGAGILGALTAKRLAATGVNVLILEPDRASIAARQSPASTTRCSRSRAGDWRAKRPSFRIEIGNDGWSWPTGAPISDAQSLTGQGLRDDTLKQAIYERTVRQIRFGTLTEQLPDPENRVTPDATARDKLGIARPHIVCRIDDYTKAGLAEARDIHEQAFRRFGATEISHKPDQDFQGAGHVMGAARMGRDAKSAVVDADLRAFDHPNLFIEGSAVFPTGGAANPTLTIAALALRSVDAIRAALTQST